MLVPDGNSSSTRDGGTAWCREQLLVALVTDGGQVWRWSACLPFPAYTTATSPGPGTTPPLDVPPTLKGERTNPDFAFPTCPHTISRLSQKAHDPASYVSRVKGPC